MLPWGGFVWFFFFFLFSLSDLLQWIPIKAFGRFLTNITLKLWSNLLVKHGHPMHICPSNDQVNAVVRKENKFKELGVSSPHTTLVHSPISLYCRDSSPPPSISGLLTKLIMAASDLHQWHSGNTSSCGLRSSWALPCLQIFLLPVKV